METGLLSTEDYNKILQNVLKTSKAELIKVDWKPISEDVEGFMGEHYNLHITYKLKDVTSTEILFIKCKPTKNQLQVEMSAEVDVYPKEIFLYEVLFKEFEKNGYDTTFASKCYYCVPKTALVLENMIVKGYILAERGQSFTLEQIKCVLKSLALFHGAGFSYERKKSEQLKQQYTIQSEYPDLMSEPLFVMSTNPNAFIMKWWSGLFKTIDTLVDLLPENEAYKSEFKQLIKRHEFGRCFTEETNLPKICGHGDLWSNNMLFKYENNTFVNCCLVDFQICRYFYPCFDVLLSVFANTSVALRKKYLMELYEYYYNTLKQTVEKYGYCIENIMTLDDFHKSIKLVQIDAMLQTVGCALIINLPKKMLSDSVKVESDLNNVLFNNHKICADTYLADECYRNMSAEVLDEYFNVLKCNINHQI